MELDLKDKTAVVTGAGRGIGLAIARALADEGVRVVGAARRITDELRGVAESTFAVDLSTPEGPPALIAHATDTLGGLDILVNNVGGFEGAPAESFLALDDDAWRSALDLNLLSAVRAIRAALPSLVERRGVIVDISSIGARAPHPPVHYGAAKAALNNLGTALAEEFGPRGVRVVTVSPGPTRSADWEAPDGFAADMARRAGVDLATFLEGLPRQLGLVTGRLAEPAEIGALVAFLVSRHAANITGSEHLVDGGVVKTV